MTAVSHSGERTRLACRIRRLAECMLLFAEAEGQRLICTRQDRKYKDESSSRRGRRDQHARRVRSPEVRSYAVCFPRSRLATRFSAPPATINSWAAGLSGGKANDSPSMVRIDLP